MWGRKLHCAGRGGDCEEQTTKDVCGGKKWTAGRMQLRRNKRNTSKRQKLWRKKVDSGKDAAEKKREEHEQEAETVEAGRMQISE
jgi:hypothetical protein